MIDKKVYHVKFDVEDDVDKFKEETGINSDNSEDIKLVPEDIIVEVFIKKRCIEMLDKIPGISVTNVKIKT